MVEIKITENEERNEYLLTPSQTFLGARYDNLSDEIKIIFPQRELDNESICTMIITSSSQEVDCVTVKHEEVFKLKSPMSHYRQVAIGFSFQKADGYIKNSNIGLFYFREAQNPDENIPVEPIQREKINLMLATGLVGVDWAEDNSNILEFKNIDGNVVKQIELPISSGPTGDFVTKEYVDKAVENLATKDEVPTKTSKLENDSNFITIEDVPSTDLSNYYTKSETESYVQKQIDNISIPDTAELEEKVNTNTSNIESVTTELSEVRDQINNIGPATSLKTYATNTANCTYVFSAIKNRWDKIYRIRLQMKSSYLQYDKYKYKHIISDAGTTTIEKTQTKDYILQQGNIYYLYPVRQAVDLFMFLTHDSGTYIYFTNDNFVFQRYRVIGCSDTSVTFEKGSYATGSISDMSIIIEYFE